MSSVQPRSDLSSQGSLPLWLRSCRQELVEPRKAEILDHPFVVGMSRGAIPKQDAERFFSGLMWHLLQFGEHVEYLMRKRPPTVSRILEGRAEDEDGDTTILRRIVVALGGPAEQIESKPWSYQPHPVWIAHDALLRSAIYSPDFPWQVGVAALNVGIESLVPTLIEPLFKASLQHYELSPHQAAWLESRSGEAEKQHGENGFLILAEFVEARDIRLQQQCRFHMDALSYSMAHGLPSSGLRSGRL